MFDPGDALCMFVQDSLCNIAFFPASLGTKSGSMCKRTKSGSMCNLSAVIML